MMFRFKSLLGALALASLRAGFSGLRRTRHIEDVPTARVRSAHQGYVELIGTAHTMNGEPIIAPLSNTSCCWYRSRASPASTTSGGTRVSSSRTPGRDTSRRRSSSVRT